MIDISPFTGAKVSSVSRLNGAKVRIVYHSDFSTYDDTTIHAFAALDGPAYIEETFPDTWRTMVPATLWLHAGCVWAYEEIELPRRPWWRLW